MVERAPAVHRAVVIDRREPAPGIVVLGLLAPQLAGAARPGQFAMVVVPESERAAVALAIYEAADSRVSLMLVVVGPRTASLAAQHVALTRSALTPAPDAPAIELAELTQRWLGLR